MSGEQGARAVRVQLPFHLRTLAGVASSEVSVEVEGAVTIRRVLDALEARYPTLAGTIRDHASGERRAYLRYFACRTDISFEPQDFVLPDEVVRGEEPLIVLGAISGG